MAEAPFTTTPQAPKEPKPVLTPDQIAFRQYFRGSFRISQGSYKGQSFIHEWTMSSGLMPPVEIPRKIPEYLKDLTPPGVHLRVSDTLIQNDRDMSWSDLYRISHAEPTIPSSDSVKSIVSEVLKRELRYQLIGRFGRNFNDDIFESHLRKVAVLKEKTDSPILDRLCIELGVELDRLRNLPTATVSPEALNSPWLKELEDLLRSNDPDQYDQAEKILNDMGNRKLLAYVEALYNRNHSGERFFPEE